MPGWLIPILNALGPVVLKWALQYLNQKYPGLSPIIKNILEFIDGQPNKQEAVNEVQKVLYTTAKLPDTVSA